MRFRQKDNARVSLRFRIRDAKVSQGQRDRQISELRAYANGKGYEVAKISGKGVSTVQRIAEWPARDDYGRRISGEAGIYSSRLLGGNMSFRMMIEAMPSNLEGDFFSRHPYYPDCADCPEKKRKCRRLGIRTPFRFIAGLPQNQTAAAEKGIVVTRAIGCPPRFIPRGRSSRGARGRGPWRLWGRSSGSPGRAVSSGWRCIVYRPC